MVRELLRYFRKKEKPSFVISIPDPCSEEWSKMEKVDDMHRHCSACERTLVDFSVMSDDELVIFFKQNNGKLCGRFRIDQLHRRLKPLPEKTTKATWWKAAMLLPFTLFSKSGSSQQLQPDSVQTEQLPFIAQSNDSIAVDWGHGIRIDTTMPWTWHDNEEGQFPWGPILTGGVPMILCDWNVTLPTICYAPVTTDSIPHAEVEAGMQAVAATSSKNIQGAASASRFGKKLAAVPKPE